MTNSNQLKARFVLLSALVLAASCLAGSAGADQQPLRIAIAASPKQFAALQTHLEQNYLVQCVRIDANKGGPIPDAPVDRTTDAYGA